MGMREWDRVCGVSPLVSSCIYLSPSPMLKVLLARSQLLVMSNGTLLTTRSRPLVMCAPMLTCAEGHFLRGNSQLFGVVGSGKWLKEAQPPVSGRIGDPNLRGIISGHSSTTPTLKGPQEPRNPPIPAPSGPKEGLTGCLRSLVGGQLEPGGENVEPSSAPGVGGGGRWEGWVVPAAGTEQGQTGPASRARAACPCPPGRPASAVLLPRGR